MAGLLKDAAEDEQENLETAEQENLETAEGGEATPEEVSELPAEGSEITPQAVRGKLNLPANLKDAYERVVLAGMKVMFSDETNEMAMNALRGDGPIDERLARGVAALMGLLIKQSNGTLPPPIVIPAGIELIAAAGDYLKKSGDEPITDDEIAGAMADYVQIIFEQAGAKSPQEMQRMLQGAMAQGGGGAPAQPAAPEAEAPPAPKGLLAQEGA